MEKIRFKDFLIDYLEFNNMTNKDFANRIGITPKHFIDILSGDRDISSQIVDNISLVTNIPTDYIYRIEANYKFEQKIENYLKKEQLSETQFLNKFKYKHLLKEKYMNFIDCENKIEIIKDILKFLRVSSPEKIYEIDQSIYYKSQNDKPELLLLWLEKCRREALKQNIGIYKKENVENLVIYILKMASAEIFNEKDIIKTFNENGIFLVIENDIPSSKIRGAFKVHNKKPAIYLTRKYRRIADIYFALLHELAHCKSDFNVAKSRSLISYESDIERKADCTAYNWMIPNDYYKTICCSINYNIADEKKYPKCFIVYRLAKDNLINYNSSEYQTYNFLLNNKEHKNNK